MEVILQKDVKSLGKTGDRVRVRPGYARNYLFPKKLAMALDESKLKEWKHKQRIIEARKKKAEKERDGLLEKLASTHLTFKRETRADGQLFGSVSPMDISRELEIKHHLSVDKRDITVEPLKTTGDHQVKVVLDSKRQTEIKVTVRQIVSEKDQTAKQEKKKPGLLSRIFSAGEKTEEEQTHESAGESAGDLLEEPKPSEETAKTDTKTTESSVPAKEDDQD